MMTPCLTGSNFICCPKGPLDSTLVRDLGRLVMKTESIPYLMYPYAEFGDTSLDGRAPADFTFQLSSRQLA
jgi:hypothetical protein